MRQWIWPAALAGGAVAWYASDSLRHRREQRSGYELRGEALDVSSPDFLRACEALTAAPISYGNQADLLINGDAIFPGFLETIRGAQRTVNLLTYVYWRGDIAHEIAGALCEKAAEGVEVNVLLDAVGTLKMDSALVGQMQEAGVCVARFPAAAPLRAAQAQQPHPPQAAGRADGTTSSLRWVRLLSYAARKGAAAGKRATQTPASCICPTSAECSLQRSQTAWSRTLTSTPSAAFSHSAPAISCAMSARQ